jgi:ABC-type nitrate/sulfonate/bicarbonate transport system permease component
VRGMDEVLGDTARSYGITGWRRVWHVTLPAAAPQIMAGVRTCLALTLILMVVSEMKGSNNGIGFLVQDSQRSFALPEMWAGILLLGLLGYLLHLVFSLVERRLLAWHRGARQTSREDA